MLTALLLSGFLKLPAASAAVNDRCLTAFSISDSMGFSATTESEVEFLLTRAIVPAIAPTGDKFSDVRAAFDLGLNDQGLTLLEVKGVRPIEAAPGRYVFNVLLPEGPTRNVEVLLDRDFDRQFSRVMADIAEWTDAGLMPVILSFNLALADAGFEPGQLSWLLYKPKFGSPPFEEIVLILNDRKRVVLLFKIDRDVLNRMRR